MDRKAQHETIARAAAAQSAQRSTFNNGVSVHKMAQSVSFANLRAIMTAANGNEQRTFVGTVDGAIVVSVNFNYAQAPPPPSAGGSRKRKKDPHEEGVDAAGDRVRRGLTNASDLSDDMIESAKAALLAMLRNLRGANGEVAVESWGLSYKKPEARNASASRPRLILSARLTPGVAVPLPSLFQALGVRCTGDGMLTTQDSTSLANGFDLPLSEQARAAETHGQRALTLFATVSQ